MWHLLQSLGEVANGRKAPCATLQLRKWSYCQGMATEMQRLTEDAC